MENQACNDKLIIPENWAKVPSYYDDLCKEMKTLFLKNPFTKEELPEVKQKFKDRQNLLTGTGPVVPGSLFLVPNADLLSNDKMKSWLPQLDNGPSFQDITPSSLPFDKDEYLNDISNIIKLNQEREKAEEIKRQIN